MQQKQHEEIKVRNPTYIALKQNMEMHILLGIQKTGLLNLPPKNLFFFLLIHTSIFIHSKEQQQKC